MENDGLSKTRMNRADKKYFFHSKLRSELFFAFLSVYLSYVFVYVDITHDHCTKYNPLCIILILNISHYRPSHHCFPPAFYQTNWFSFRDTFSAWPFRIFLNKTFKERWRSIRKENKHNTPDPHLNWEKKKKMGLVRANFYVLQYKWDQKLKKYHFAVSLGALRSLFVQSYCLNFSLSLIADEMNRKRTKTLRNDRRHRAAGGKQCE